MKKIVRIISQVAFLAFCILMVIKEVGIANQQREIIREIANHFNLNLPNGNLMLRNQPELIIALWLCAILLYIANLYLGSEKKFKPIPNQEYEILKQTDDENYHAYVLGHSGGENFYDIEILEWCGEAIFTGDGNNNKFFIVKSDNGYEFMSNLSPLIEETE